MFLGEYTQKLSGKRRFLLPVKMRQQIQGDNVVLSKGFENCLFGYDQNRWEQTANKELDSSITNINSRDLRRYIFSGAAVTNLDPQGRLIIPPPLLQYASIKNEIVIIGAGDHFEIWHPEFWAKKLKQIEKSALGSEKEQ